MRTFGWLMLAFGIAFGIVYAVSNMRDEFRGETGAYSPGLRASSNRAPDH